MGYWHIVLHVKGTVTYFIEDKEAATEAEAIAKAEAKLKTDLPDDDELRCEGVSDSFHKND